MNATKEEARIAQDELKAAADLIENFNILATYRNAIQERLARVDLFLELAEYNLPTEASHAAKAKPRARLRAHAAARH